MAQLIKEPTNAPMVARATICSNGFERLLITAQSMIQMKLDAESLSVASGAEFNVPAVAIRD